jgi:hypothetical protein
MDQIPNIPFYSRDFPVQSRRSYFSEPLQSSGKLTYLDFVGLVKEAWEQSHPNIPVVPMAMNEYDMLCIHPAVIVYSMELRKTHVNEPKPKIRQVSNSEEVTVYGQKYQNIISFTIMARVGKLEGQDPSSVQDDLDKSVLCDQIIEEFEDFMLEYTPVFKYLGANELTYSRRLSDSEVARRTKDVHKRTVTYMLTTEKTFAVRNRTIEEIAINTRVKCLLAEIATPNILGILESLSDLPKTGSNQGDAYYISGLRSNDTLVLYVWDELLGRWISSTEDIKINLIDENCASNHD